MSTPRSRCHPGALGSACLAFLAYAAAPAAAGESAGTVLDWSSSYWRYFLCLRAPEFGTPIADGKEKTRPFLHYQRGWHIGFTQARVGSGALSEDWMKPEFNASAWASRKGGLQEGGSWYDPVVRVACLRGRFEAPDPAKVTKLELEIQYLGGVAIYLNGQEIERKHLPAGKLSGDTLAEGYPAEAYAWGIPLNKRGYAAAITEWQAPSEKAGRFRRTSVAIDPKRLIKGTNVLGLALHRSGYHAAAGQWSYEAMNGYRNTPWPHMGVLQFKLQATPAEALARPDRPPGVQIWAEDMHRRLVNRDWGEARSAPAAIRIVGARNGTHSGQVVVSTSESLSGLSAQLGDLVRVGGAGKIPSSACLVRYASGTPLDRMRESAFGRHIQFYNSGADRLLGAYATVFFKDGEDHVRPSPQIQAEAQAIALFDHLAEKPPITVPAAACQPVWITVKVPPDAPAGAYRGTLLLQAGGSRKVEVKLQVMDWSLPEGKDLGAFVGLQPSLFSACAEYKCTPWSEEHWKHLERSARLLGEVGNDLAVLPLIVGGEAANEESLVPWIEKGGAYEYDWKNLDRYLGLLTTYWGKKTAVVGEICWAPYTEKGWVLVQPGVTVSAGGQKKKRVLPAAESDEWKKAFLPFAKAVSEHVKARGISDFYWGWFYDNASPILPMAGSLAGVCPGVGWARASHDGFRKQPLLKESQATNLDLHIRGFQEPFTRAGEPLSQQGWKAPRNVLFPRHASQVQAIGRVETPMALRWLPENCLVNGAAGFGRLGADYWLPFEFSNWYHPFSNYILCPGPEGVEGTIRFEALREGLQEAEVRIQLEKASKDQTEPAKSVLADRIRSIGALPTGSDYQPMCEYYGGWQERSWDLYAAAAAAANGKAPSVEERARFFGDK